MRDVGVHSRFAPFADDAMLVAHCDLLASHAETPVMIRTSNGRRARSAEDHPHFINFLSRELQSVQKRRAGDDGGAVLIVVEYRNRQGFAQRLLNHEAFWSFDILQIDAAK